MLSKNGSGNGNGHTAQAGQPSIHLFGIVADGGGKAHAVDICAFPSSELKAFDIAAKYQAENSRAVGVYSLPFNEDPSRMHQTMLASKGVRTDLAMNKLTLVEPSPVAVQPAAEAPAQQHTPAPN